MPRDAKGRDLTEPMETPDPTQESVEGVTPVESVRVLTRV